MRLHLLLCLFGLSTSLAAQTFLNNPDRAAKTLPELQRQFDDWSRTHDRNQERHWKYYKRFEMDMQMHTNGQGQATDPSAYTQAAVSFAAEKQNQLLARSNSSAWYPIGPYNLPNNLTGYMENGMGRINCMAFHPTNPNIFYVGVAQGGVWKTIDNGVSWTPLTDQLPILRISDIVVDPNDPDNTMYISVCDFEYIGFGLYLNGRKRHTHYGLGVYKTTDGGATWNPTGLTFQMTDGDGSLIRKILIDPTNNNTLLACGVSGMYRSTDAGATWTNVQTGLFWDLLQDPLSANVVYAATGWVMNANDGTAGIYKSTDFGQNWTMLNTGIQPTGVVQRIKLAIAPSDPNYIYALTVDVNFGLYGFYKTTNAGNTWSYIIPVVNVLDGGDGTSTGGQGTYDLGLLVDATNRNTVYVGGVNFWSSTDGAYTFHPVAHWTLNYGPTIHGDFHYFTRNPLNGMIFACSDGGVYRTSSISNQTWGDAYSGSPWPTLWENISNGMQITSFYRLSSSRNVADRLVAGAQDNATFYFENGTWHTIFGGDGMDNYLDPNDDNHVIGFSQYGYFWQSFDDGFSNVAGLINPNNEPGEWVAPFMADYNTAGTFYAGFVNVTQTYDNGLNWSPISNFPYINQPAEISAMAISNSNSSVLYVCKRVRYEHSEPGAVYTTTNGGGTWTNITAGLPDSLYYTGVEASENDENSVYVCLAGLVAGQKVFHSSNGGSSWQNISYNLPNIPVNCIKYIPGANTMMIATDLGVYVLDETNNTWVNQSAGLPNVIISDIDFNVVQNKIYISTFGRGIWATDLSLFLNAVETNVLTLGLELFPSPNNGSFTLTISGENTQAEMLALDIIDVMGRIVSTEQLQGGSRYTISKSLPAGMYYAHVYGAKTSGVKRFVVE
jgi:photosystem II stability/assembly factor-like uncharacterized protein